MEGLLSALQHRGDTSANQLVPPPPLVKTWLATSHVSHCHRVDMQNTSNGKLKLGYVYD